ncbi:MAG: hypothetical protein LQ346_003250 [Caloplaca aetnensis]|nr:MAG: hypothetical protein LQ346_003250 [Caloplaca aetnensis]
MAVRGQRFHIDLDDDKTPLRRDILTGQSATRNPWNLVTDIQERSNSTGARPPSPPKLKSSETGFPAHKKRSAFKQRMNGNGNAPGNSPSPNAQMVNSEAMPSASTHQQTARAQIDMENRRRIANMSSEDIESAWKELMSGLSESLVERLLKKANIEEGQDQDVEGVSTYGAKGKPYPSKSSSRKKVTFDPVFQADEAIETPLAIDKPYPGPEYDGVPVKPPLDAQPVSSFQGWPVPPSFHFPQPPSPPSLDPEDPDFLSKLHSTYFPSLPSNPNALSWMQPPDPAENEAYSPSQDNLAPSAVRFDFRGRLLPPRLASQIPTTKGLHHHGIAPEAAGYTIPELAHLSRSSIPSQRCIAYQTLGRILYRLGTGVFGQEDHELCQGLWKCMEQGRVLDTLTAEAARGGESGNRTCWVTATEAVWLWRKGGGRKWRAN